MSTPGDGELLLLAFDRVRSGVALIDSAGSILRVNPAGAAIAGRSPDQVVGTALFDLLAPGDHGTVLAELAAVSERGHAGPVDLNIRRPDGTTVWISATGTLLSAEGAGTIYVIFDDVTAVHELTERYDEATAELHREYEIRLRRAKAFADFASLTSRTTTEAGAEAVIEGITAMAIEHLADLAAVVLLEEDGERMRIADVRFWDPSAESELRERLQHHELGRPFGPLGDALESGVPVLEFEGPVHPEMPRLVGDWTARNAAGERRLYPLRSPAGPLGVLILMRLPEADPFTADDGDLAMVLSSRAAVAVHNVRIDARRAAAEAAIERRRAQQEAVAQLGTLALSGAPIEELTDRCCALVEAILGAMCAVLIGDDHPDGMLLMAASDALGLTPGELRFNHDPGFVSLLDAEGSVLVPDNAVEQRYTPMPGARALGIRSGLATKIESGIGTNGVLTAVSKEVDAFDAEDVTFLGGMANVIASAIDSKHALDELRHNALHDALTGLPNRVLVLDRLELALEQSSSRGNQVAVLACDLDRFKVVNDGLGHSAGDEVLRLVADRLRLQVRPGDTVGRFGGDEFIVVCPDVADLESVVAIAVRLAGAFSEPIDVHGIQVVVTASIGIAFESGTGPEAAQGLLRDADAAMYRAKDRGRNRFELFDDAMRVWASQRLTTETELRRALDHGELLLHYQPILDLEELTPVGCEALIRWEHPERGLLEPAEFLGVAVETGLILELGGWVFEEAARQVAAWDDSHREHGWWVAVNLAPRQLSDPRLLERIDGALDRTGAAPERLRVEITEEALIEDTTQMADILEALRRRGLGISVDDFGTGYSSLAYLKRLPLDSLKLDRGFVAGLGEDSDDMVIAAAITVMAQALGLRVVAEGVETVGQLEVLRAMGCDLAQGFLFAEALPPASLEDWEQPKI